MKLVDTLDLPDIQKKSILSVIESTPYDINLLSLYQGTQENGVTADNDGFEKGREEEKRVVEPVVVTFPLREPNDISHDVGL